MHSRITENIETAEIRIGEEVISGWFDTESCTGCGIRRIYHEEFDTYFCPECNCWLEAKCSDSTCSFCSSRPKQPLRY